MVDKRKFNGSDPKWRSGKTTVIRVPETLKSKILGLITVLDQVGDEVLVIDKVTYEQAISLLESSLLEKANCGGRIKAKVKEALTILNLK